MQASTTSSVMEFYRNIISSPLLLADGYNLISKFLFESQKNRRDTILNLLDPNIPILSLLINIYPQEVFQSEIVDKPQKDNTVQFLLDLLVGELLKPSELMRKKVIDQLFEFMHKIHNSQGFDQWVDLYLRCCSKLEGSGSRRLAYFLINVFKYADDRVSVLTQQILKSIVGYQFENKEEKLEIFYYILKSLAFKVDTDPDAIDNFVSPYGQTILEYAAVNMKISAITLKFSLKIMTLLFGDYSLECPVEFAKQIEQTAVSLIQEYVLFLNKSNHYWKGVAEIEEDDQQPIETALYQMLQLFMTLFGARVKLNLQIMVYLCIISTFLGEQQYNKYVQFPDQYLMDIEDEGEMNIRNKSIFFLQEMLQNQKIGKKSVAFLREYTLQVLGNFAVINKQIQQFLIKYKLPLITLKVTEVYKESALFILYSFTDQLLQGNTTKMSVMLGNQVKSNTPNSIDTILAIVILNKCLNSQPENQKQYYIMFLREMCGKYSSNIGMLIAIARGVHKYFPLQEIVIVNNVNEKGVPFILIDKLLTYLQGSDSAQEESGYLILEFFIYLLKNQQNKVILKNIITFEKEVIILKKYLKNGISEGLVCDLTCLLANPYTLQALYKQIQNGFVKDETLSKIISKCIRNKSITLNQMQIINLCQIYINNLDLICEIVSAYIQTFNISNNELALFLSTKQKREWIPGLLKQGKLLNIQSIFINSVAAITNDIDSLQELQNELVVPYFIILQNTQNAITILNTNNIMVQFLQKLYRYSRLFQGVHLKIMTSHVFLTLAERLPHLVPKVVELIQHYGKLQSSQWQEEDLDIQDIQYGEAADGIIQKLFNRIVNDRAQEVLKIVFGELSWDSKKLYQRLALLQSGV